MATSRFCFASLVISPLCAVVTLSLLVVGSSLAARGRVVVPRFSRVVLVSLVAAAALGVHRRGSARAVPLAARATRDRLPITARVDRALDRAPSVVVARAPSVIVVAADRVPITIRGARVALASRSAPETREDARKCVHGARARQDVGAVVARACAEGRARDVYVSRFLVGRNKFS
jgi:hypothetical protein